MKKINVWVIPAFYPSNDHPIRGIFFKEQTEAISKYVNNITIIYPESRSIREMNFKKIVKFHFNKTISYENGIKVYRYHRWNLLRLQFNSLLAQKKWANSAFTMSEKLIRNGEKPDIIHAHCAVGAGMAALMLKQKYNIPYIVTEHTTAYATNKGSIKLYDTIREVFNNANRIVAVSNPFKALLQEKINIDNDSFNVLPNFIDTNYFTIPVQKHAKLVFLTVCHLQKKKRVDRLLHAFAKIKDLIPNSSLIIAGAGPEEEILKKLAQSLELDNTTEFYGEATRLQVKVLMQRANCFVLPSDYETFGVVLIEALACGLPIIATKSGGPEDIVNESNGFLVEKNIESIADAMLAFYKKKDYFNSNELRAEAVEKYSLDAVSRKYYSLYLEAIG